MLNVGEYSRHRVFIRKARFIKKHVEKENGNADGWGTQHRIKD